MKHKTNTWRILRDRLKIVIVIDGSVLDETQGIKLVFTASESLVIVAILGMQWHILIYITNKLPIK